MSSEDLVREAQDPSTTPGRLAELAQADRATWPAIVFNPAAYDGLLQWLGERGDPTVDAALSARAAQAAALNPPTPPAPPAPPAPPVAEEPVEPVAPEPVEPVSPVAEPVVPAAQAPHEQAPVEPAHEPTVVIPSQQAATASDPEPTAVFPSEQPAHPGHDAPAATTSAFGAVPPAGTPPHAAPADGDGDGSGSGARPLGVVIAMVVVVLALIGGAAWGATEVFGGDDDTPTISAGGDATTDAPEPDDEPTTAAPSTEAPDDSGDSTTSGEFCTEMTDIQQRSMDVLGGTGTGSGSTPDLEDIQEKSRELIQSYKDLEDIAPAEVKGDLETMSSYLDTMMNPAAGGGADGMDEYFAAAQRLGTYYAQNCL